MQSDEELLIGAKTPEIVRKKSISLNIKKDKSRSSSLVEKSSGPSVASVSDKSQRKASKSKDDKLVLDNISATKKNKKSKNKDPEGSSSKKPKKSKSKKGEKEDTVKTGGPKREKSKSGVSVNKLQKFGTENQTNVKKCVRKTMFYFSYFYR